MYVKEITNLKEFHHSCHCVAHVDYRRRAANGRPDPPNFPKDAFAVAAVLSASEARKAIQFTKNNE